MHKRKKIVKLKGARTFKFSNGNKLNSLYNVILPCVIADIEASIITDVMNSGIPLLLSKDALKRAGTCLNFEDDTVTMLKKKIPLSCTSSGHYDIPITKPLPDKCKFKHVPLIKEISSKNTSEKIKSATKLHRQFSHPSSKKLCDLVKKCRSDRSWGSCLRRKNPLFNVATLSYLLLQNLCPTEMKTKRGKNC